MSAPTEEKISISLIRIDQAAQQREHVSQDTMKDYAEALNAGCILPPLDVFFDGKDYWLGGGFHRLGAAQLAGRTDIKVWVHKGGLREAILFSCSANSDHGLRRTNADKKRAVLTLLSDSEWKEWSAREIAKHCSVSHSFVNDIKDELSGSGVRLDAVVKVERKGKIYSHTLNRKRKVKAVHRDSVFWSEIVSSAFELQKLLANSNCLPSQKSWPWFSDLQANLDSLIRASTILKNETQSREIAHMNKELI